MKNNYPIDSIQSLAQSWWIKSDSEILTRGSLVNTYVQFFYQIPRELVAEREDPYKHDKVTIKSIPLSPKQTHQASSLPIAAFPRLEGADCFIINRAKRRPCIVIGEVSRPPIAKSLIRGMSKHQTAPFVAIAPYYGVEQNSRAGYNPEFVERIKHASYPQFMWDILPHSEKESILRLDQIQPLGIHYQSYEHSGYKLSEEALALFDEWLY